MADKTKLTLEESVLKRPGMYIGYLDWRGLHILMADAIRAICLDLPCKEVPLGLCLNGNVRLSVHLTKHVLNMRFHIGELIVDDDVDFQVLSKMFEKASETRNSDLEIAVAVSEMLSIHLGDEQVPIVELFRKNGDAIEGLNAPSEAKTLHLKMSLLPVLDLTNLDQARFEALCFGASQVVGGLILTDVQLGEANKVWLA